MCTQLNQYFWAQDVHDEHAKRDMFYPGRDAIEPEGLGKTNRMIKWINSS